MALVAPDVHLEGFSGFAPSDTLRRQLPYTCNDAARLVINSPTDNWNQSFAIKCQDSRREYGQYACSSMLMKLIPMCRPRTIRVPYRNPY